MADSSTGIKNTGGHNSGTYNSGDYNSGTRNSGDYNSGTRNSGTRNSGDYNSGTRNSGYSNSGYYNSGTHNSGNYNSGDSNSGYSNSGYSNSGYYNSGDYNSGYYNSGFFNTDEPTVRLFNIETNLKRSDIIIPYIYLPVTEWVSESGMTTKQKQEDPQFHVKGGTLINRSYKAAWGIAWDQASQDLKQQFLELPNFDAEIFETITGIDVKLEGKVKIEVDGKVVYISTESAKALNLIK